MTITPRLCRPSQPQSLKDALATLLCSANSRTLYGTKRTDIKRSYMMQTQSSTPPPIKRERRRPQISCTECRRRKQKCNPRKDGPCTNCMRRYPPVQCYVQQFKDDRGPLKSKDKKGSQSRGSLNASKSLSDNSRSSTETPPILEGEDVRVRYASIPLSRILHPQSEAPPIYTPGNLTVPVRRAPKLIAPHDGSSNEDEGVEELPLQQNLKFMDPGFREAMHKRLAGGESPRSIGGIVEMMNTFNAFPVKTSLRNTELFSFYHHYVAPRLCSVDGSDFHPLFAKEILPWQIQSTLMPNVAILMASATRGYLQDPTSEMSSETLVIKDHVLKLVNKFIRQDFHLVAHQAMRIIIHLVIIEWWWGSEDSVWFHMNGIKRMLELRGGLQAMNDPLNMNVLIVTDYELACGYERHLCFLTTEEALSAVLPIQETYPEKFRCPLLKYPTTFRDCRDKLGLSLEVAVILDDLRFLTSSITEPMLNPEMTPVKTAKIIQTAEWIKKQVISLLEGTVSPPSNPEALHGHEINQTILLAALISTHCISTLTPFVKVTSPPDTSIAASYNAILANILVIPLSTWKEIPGLFFWILLVATPASEGDLRGRFLRKQMACTGMTISLGDFLLGTAFLRSFWTLQLWIKRERECKRGDTTMNVDVD